MSELGFYIDSAGRVITSETQSMPPKIANGYELLNNPESRVRMGQEMASFTQAVHEATPDVLVFLDKSARPASWFFRYMWQELYPSEKRPRIKYANIGTEKGLSEDDEYAHLISGKDVISKFSSNSKLIESLKKAFSVGKSDMQNESGTYLDDKNVWVIDEVSNTGATLKMATELFHATFDQRVRSITPKYIFSKDDHGWLRDSDMIGVRDGKPSDMLTKPIRPIPHEVHQLRSELRLLAHQTVKDLQPHLAA